jgi:hypothetical protein
MAFKRLVRCALGNRITYGDLISVNGETYNVRRLSGSPFGELTPTDEIGQVDKVSHCPLWHMSDTLLLSSFFFFFFNFLASLPNREHSDHHVGGTELPRARKGS